MSGFGQDLAHNTDAEQQNGCETNNYCGIIISGLFRNQTDCGQRLCEGKVVKNTGHKHHACMHVTKRHENARNDYSPRGTKGD